MAISRGENGFAYIVRPPVKYLSLATMEILPATDRQPFFVAGNFKEFKRVMLGKDRSNAGE